MCDCFGCCKGSKKFVCFGCRTTAKGGSYGAWGSNSPKHTQKTPHPNCPKCRKPMVNLGTGARIPAKTNDRRWKSMEAFFISAIRRQAAAAVEEYV